MSYIQKRNYAFEMMHTLIDVENKASVSISARIFQRTSTQLFVKSFYKNEEDATKFYSDMMVRKKENGGKYNEKFLDYQPLESEFDDEE